MSFRSIHGPVKLKLKAVFLTDFIPVLSLLSLCLSHTLILVYMPHSNWEQFSFQPVLHIDHSLIHLPANTSFNWPFADTTGTRYHTTTSIFGVLSFKFSMDMLGKISYSIVTLPVMISVNEAIQEQKVMSKTDQFTSIILHYSAGEKRKENNAHLVRHLPPSTGSENLGLWTLHHQLGADVLLFTHTNTHLNTREACV